MAGEKQNAIHSEQAIRPSRGQRMKRTCARWWWLLLLILACIVLVVVLPLIYVAYPKMARKAVSESSLNVVSMTIENPEPNSVQLSFTQTFETDSKYYPTLYPFNGSFYLIDKPDNPAFASIRTPKVVAQNGTESQVPAQTVNITFPDEFTRYVLLAFESENFTIALRGNGDLKQGSLPKTTVSYDQNITMKGFNRLPGFELLSFHTTNTTASDGTNSYGTASIVNPTVMTLDLGRVALGMSVAGTDVGTAYIDPLVLKPGNNTVEMRAEVYQLVVVGIVLQRGNAVIPVDIKGINSTVDGQLLPYYTAMLEETAMQVELNVTQAVEGSGLVDKRSLALLH